MILAIDPGNARSGFCFYAEDAHRVDESGVGINADILTIIKNASYNHVAIEMIASYGMPVGAEVFETCVWIGRFVQRCFDPDAAMLVYRRDVKLHLCGNSKAKDGNVRQALLDLFARTGGGSTPQIGIKSKPGPLYGVSSHAWPALGVAITAAHHRRMRTAA